MVFLTMLSEDVIYHRMVVFVASNELERVWHQAVLASFQALPQHWSGGTVDGYNTPHSL